MKQLWGHRGAVQRLCVRQRILGKVTEGRAVAFLRREFS